MFPSRNGRWRSEFRQRCPHGRGVLGGNFGDHVSTSIAQEPGAITYVASATAEPSSGRTLCAIQPADSWKCSINGVEVFCCQSEIVRRCGSSVRDHETTASNLGIYAYINNPRARANQKLSITSLDYCSSVFLHFSICSIFC